LGETVVVEVKNDSVNEYSIKPEDFGLQKANSFSDISGHVSVEKNMNLALDILLGKASKSYIDFLKINQIVCEEFFKNL
jgi:anthranilate phosphoribosyltransferase